MARDPRIESLLVEWGQYVNLGGECSGFPSINVLSADWSPPSPGTTPTLKVASHSRAKQTHRAIGFLSIRLANTLVVHYCMRLSVEDQAERLGCEISTVHARIESAHRQLRPMLKEFHAL